jgi:hypothetical protein
MIVAVALAATAAAQQTKQPPAKEPTKNEAPAAKPAPEPAGLPVNVKIEVSITDQTGTNAPAKKVVTMLTTDRQSNSIRSSASVPVKMGGGPPTMPSQVTYRNVTINVDARPTIIAKEPNKVLVAFGLEYLPKSAGGAEELEPGMSQLNERLSLVLESGKPMIVSQAADPVSDRKITVEVTATILR